MSANEFWGNVRFVGRLFCDLWRRIFCIFCIALLLSACGCMNIYTRFPGTDAKITQVYQCSRTVAAFSVIVAFPQMMSDNPGDYGLQWMNVLTVPIGCLCLCDAVAEACVDTVCLPFDWPISAKRKRDLERWQEERRREYEASRQETESEVR